MSQTFPNHTEQDEEDAMRVRKDAARLLGTLGGKARTPKKALSSKKNGLKGGRPKKSATLNS